MIGEKWTHVLCDSCWGKLEPDRIPYRMRADEGADHGPIEVCCLCGLPTTSGIYKRMSPDTAGLVCQDASPPSDT